MLSILTVKMEVEDQFLLIEPTAQDAGKTPIIFALPLL